MTNILNYSVYLSEKISVKSTKDDLSPKINIDDEIERLKKLHLRAKKQTLQNLGVLEKNTIKY